MENIVIVLIVAGVVGLAGRYLWKSKKRGVKCVGCPDGHSCGGCSCQCHNR